MHDSIERKIRLTKAVRAAIYNDIVRRQMTPEQVSNIYNVPISAVTKIVRDFGKDLQLATQADDTALRLQQFEALRNLANMALQEFEKSKGAATTVRVAREWIRSDDPLIKVNRPIIVEHENLDHNLRDIVTSTLDSTRPDDPTLILSNQKESIEISNRPGDPRFISTALSAISEQSKLLGLNRPPREDMSTQEDQVKVYLGFDPDNPDVTPEEMSITRVDETVTFDVDEEFVDIEISEDD